MAGIKIISLLILALFLGGTALADDATLTVAVADFENNIRGYPWHLRGLGEVAAENLTSILPEKENIRVVERKRLKTVMGEHELSEAGLLAEEEKAAELGKLVGAGGVITGSINDLKLEEKTFSGYGVETSRVEAELKINIRLVDVETGVIEFARVKRAAGEYEGESRHSIDKESVSRELLNRALEEFAFNLEESLQPEKDD